jgi:hypothetical protein
MTGGDCLRPGNDPTDWRGRKSQRYENNPWRDRHHRDRIARGRHAGRARWVRGPAPSARPQAAPTPARLAAPAFSSTRDGAQPSAGLLGAPAFSSARHGARPARAGRDGLVFGYDGRHNERPAIWHTADGGAHWRVVYPAVG